MEHTPYPNRSIVCMIFAVTFRAFVGIAFVLHLFVGNVCVMGTAHAASPSTATVASKEIPLSFNVIRCTWVKTDDGWVPTPDSPCASGHCIKQDAPETRCLTAHVVETPAATLSIGSPLADIAFRESSTNDARIPDIPPPYPGITSTVLRL